MPSLLARCVHGFSKTPAHAPIAPLIHEQTQSALCQLPADILEAITDALTPVERICLALTCKGLMGICMPKDLEKVKKHPSQTFQLLMNLEVLGGDQYPCYSCSKFHKRKSGRGPLERLATIGKRSFPKDGGLVEICSHYHLRNSLFQSAWRHKFSRGPMGLLMLPALHTCVARQDPRDGPMTLMTHMKIIDGVLFLRRRFSAHVNLTRNILKQLECFTGRGCPHQGEIVLPQMVCAISHVLANDPTFIGKYYPGCEAHTFQCDKCATDMDISVMRPASHAGRARSDGCELRLNVYQGLGRRGECLPKGAFWNVKQKHRRIPEYGLPKMKPIKQIMLIGSIPAYSLPESRIPGLVGRLRDWKEWTLGARAAHMVELQRGYLEQRGEDRRNQKRVLSNGGRNEGEGETGVGRSLSCT